MVARFSNHKLSGDDSQDSVIIFSCSSLPDRFFGAHIHLLFLPYARVPGVFILFAKDTDPLINSTKIGPGLSDGRSDCRWSYNLLSLWHPIEITCGDFSSA